MRAPATILLLTAALTCAAADHEQFRAMVKLTLQGTQLVLVDSLPFRLSKGQGDQLALYDVFGTRFNVTATLRPDDSIFLVRIERLTSGNNLPEPVITVPAVLSPDFDPLAVHGIVVPTQVEADKAQAVQANLGGGAMQGTASTMPRTVSPGLRGTIIPPIQQPSPN